MIEASFSVRVSGVLQTIAVARQTTNGSVIISRYGGNDVYNYTTHPSPDKPVYQFNYHEKAIGSGDQSLRCFIKKDRPLLHLLLASCYPIKVTTGAKKKRRPDLRLVPFDGSLNTLLFAFVISEAEATPKVEPHLNLLSFQIGLFAVHIIYSFLHFPSSPYGHVISSITNPPNEACFSNHSRIEGGMESLLPAELSGKVDSALFYVAHKALENGIVRESLPYEVAKVVLLPEVQAIYKEPIKDKIVDSNSRTNIANMVDKRVKHITFASRLSGFHLNDVSSR